MWTGNFSSLIEIVAGFNFALVASNSFLKELSTSISGNSKARELNGQVESISSNQFAVLQEYIKINIDQAILEIFGDILGRHQEIDRKRREFTTELDSDIEQRSRSKIFGRFCLFGGIQAVLYLLISGIEFQDVEGASIALRDGCVEYFILLNLISTILMYLWNFVGFFGIKATMKSTIAGYIVVLFISFFVWLTFEELCGITIQIPLINAYGISFLFSTTSHFIVFLLLAFGKESAKSQENFAKIETIKTEFETLDIKIDTVDELKDNFKIQ